MIQTRYFVIASVAVLFFALVFLFGRETEPSQSNSLPSETIIMAEPKDVSITPAQGDNWYMKRALFIEKIRSTLQIDPISEPGPEPQPQPEPNPIPTPSPKPSVVPPVSTTTTESTHTTSTQQIFPTPEQGITTTEQLSTSSIPYEVN